MDGQVAVVRQKVVLLTLRVMSAQVQSLRLVQLHTRQVRVPPDPPDIIITVQMKTYASQTTVQGQLETANDVSRELVVVS